MVLNSILCHFQGNMCLHRLALPNSSHRKYSVSDAPRVSKVMVSTFPYLWLCFCQIIFPLPDFNKHVQHRSIEFPVKQLTAVFS